MSDNPLDQVAVNEPDDGPPSASSDAEVQPRPSLGLIALGLAFLVLGIIAGLVMSAATFR